MSTVIFHTCPECGTRHTNLQEVTLTLERGATRLEFKGVPAYVCPACGEEFVPAPFAEAVSAAAGDIFEVHQRLGQDATPASYPFRSLEVTRRDGEARASA